MPKTTAAPFPVTVAEVSGYTRTSTHKDVIAFLDRLAPKTASMKILSMGRSGEGQEMPVAVLSKRKLFTPAQAHKSGKPVVLVIANIHAGEVEGKEACQMLARDIATGRLARLMEGATILLIPDYNPDGNDRIDRKNRALDLKELEGQVGPEGGVGTRYTGQGINLNRDYTKLEAVESRNLSRLVGEWNPHVVVDCHTTDGSIHGYDLTFDTSHTVESGPRAPILYARDTMLPAIAKSLRKRTGHRTFFYGNFRDQDDPTKGWETYPALPRYGSHYRGLTGRMDILLEAYSYIDFRARCDVMYSILVEIFDYVVRHGAEIRKIVDAAAADTVARGRAPAPDDLIGVNYGVPMRGPSGELLYRYPAHPLYPFKAEAWDLESQRARRVPGRKRATYPTLFHGRFIPTKAVRRPLAYLIPSSESRIAEHLRLHNVVVTALKAPREYFVEHYVVLGRETTSSPDVGTETRTESVFWTRGEQGPHRAGAGDFLVEMAQPLAAVAAYLLEPESDDGFVRWNFFDGVKTGEVYPVRRVLSS